MPTASDAARTEAALWAGLADTTSGLLAHLGDTPPDERSVVRFYDPAVDLARRGDGWGYAFTTCDMPDVARFAAGLAEAEAEAWDSGTGDVATRAYAERRFLLADRVLHWAVPWLDAVGRCYGDVRGQAHTRRDDLLDLGDRHRPAPLLARGEGLYPPGHDAFGPLEADAGSPELVASLWSGAVVLAATVRSLTGGRASRLTSRELRDPATRRDLVIFYEVQAARWRRMADTHPGSAALWSDLAVRADVTARRLA